MTEGRRGAKIRSFKKSGQAFEAAQKVLVGGVNSPGRAFKGVGGTPVFLHSAQGPVVRDLDGNEYIDFVLSWGPMVLGHRHPAVIKAIENQLQRGLGFGAPGAGETALAGELVSRVPGLEKVRLVVSGTEATLSAVRLARAATGRELIIKIDGGYHGHGDSFLVSAGSGALTLGTPSSPGVPVALAALTRVAQFNRLDTFEAIFKKEKGRVAAMIVETVPGNCGVLPPQKGFLKELKKLCQAHGALLILDEVMCGFRTGVTAASRFGVVPDLMCLGKIIGGGLPLAAYGGRAELMDQISPSGPVYQAGTLSGNPVAVAAGLATLKALTSNQLTLLEERSQLFENRLKQEITASGAAKRVTLNRVGSMFTLFFTPGPVRTYEDAKRSDTAAFARFFHAALAEGINLPPSQFEAFFLSLAHTAPVLKQAAQKIGLALRKTFSD